MRTLSLWETNVRITFRVREEHEALFKKSLLDGKPQLIALVLKTIISKQKMRINGLNCPN
jgi:hypothetical protein